MIKGLTDEEVKKRVEEGKINSSNTNNLKSNFEIVRDNVCTLFNLFNLIIAIALACVHAYTNMVFIVIIIINVLIGIIQEIHGKNLVKKLSILTTAKSKVVRNGEEKEIDINEIVLDDVILLSQGDQIPSDAFVIEGEIEVNESLLTGESDTILKTKEDKLLSKAYKLVLNTTYGIMGDKFNPMYDLKQCSGVCRTGQLLLTALACRLTNRIPTLKIIQTNTDGILILCKKVDMDTVLEEKTNWENLTGIHLDIDDALRIWQMNVNNYILEIMEWDKKEKKMAC